MKKERHGFLTFWIIAGLIMNIICVFLYAFSIDDYDFQLYFEVTNEQAILYTIYSFIACIGSVLLLNWKLSGFVIHCIISILPIFSEPVAYMIILGILSPLLDFALLQLKKNGISAWTHLRGDYSNIEMPEVNNVETIHVEEKPIDIKKCPYCAEEIKKEAIVCRFCNRNIN